MLGVISTTGSMALAPCFPVGVFRGAWKLPPGASLIRRMCGGAGKGTFISRGRLLILGIIGIILMPCLRIAPIAGFTMRMWTAGSRCREARDLPPWKGESGSPVGDPDFYLGQVPSLRILTWGLSTTRSTLITRFSPTSALKSRPKGVPIRERTFRAAEGITTATA